jgi:hypothetical protein
VYPSEIGEWEIDLICANCDKEILSTDPEVTCEFYGFQWNCTKCEYLNDYEVPDCDPDLEYELARDMEEMNS